MPGLRHEDVQDRRLTPLDSHLVRRRAGIAGAPLCMSAPIRGWVRTIRSVENEAGRPVLAVDLGGTQIRAALITPDLEVHRRRAEPTRDEEAARAAMPDSNITVTTLSVAIGIVEVFVAKMACVPRRALAARLLSRSRSASPPGAPPASRQCNACFANSTVTRWPCS